ncbi:MAG: DNA-binding MarR family transcriptional regulator [Candidatus Azotimanducaceae bacterium]|jgi:DNA-binding MarR family transcriptional regulator
MMSKDYSAWELTDTIGHLHTLLGAVIERQVKPLGLTRAQAIALGILAERPQGISQAEWARLQGVTRQHAHAIAHRLEHEGWIIAKRLGRERVVALSKTGFQKVEALRPEMELSLQAVFDGLSPDENHVLLGLLSKLTAFNSGSGSSS